MNRAEKQAEKRQLRSQARIVQVETFCQALQEGKTATQAYRITYPDKAVKWTDASLQQKAWEMSKSGDVLTRLREIQVISAKKHQVSIESLTEEFEQARFLAQITGNASAMNQSTLGKAKIHGIGNEIKFGLADELMDLIMGNLPDTTSFPS